MSNGNIALVQNLYAAFGKGDVASIINGLAPDVDWGINGRRKDYPVFGAWKGAAGAQQFFTLVSELESFTDFSPKDFQAVGDNVFAFGSYAGSIKATGKPFG